MPRCLDADERGHLLYLSFGTMFTSKVPLPKNKFIYQQVFVQFFTLTLFPHLVVDSDHGVADDSDHSVCKPREDEKNVAKILSRKSSRDLFFCSGLDISELSFKTPSKTERKGHCRGI